MKFRNFSDFILLLWINLLFIVVLSVPVKTSAQVPQPTFVCLGDCPEISTNPTNANQVPAPSAANAAVPQATAVPAQVANNAPANQPCQPVTAVHSAQERKFKHKKKSDGKSSNLDTGLLQKLIKLIEQLIALIQQILVGGLPSAQNAINNQGGTAGGANMLRQAVPGQAVNPQVTLPPCPTNTPPANQANQQAQTQPAANQQANGNQAAQPAEGQNQPAQANQNPATQAANMQPAGGANVTHSAQCDATKPPPGAQEAGLTKLAFCEDFSDPSRIDFDNKPVAGKTTFAAMRPGNIFGATAELSSDFTFTPEGTLQSRSKAGNYQADFISTWPTGGGNHAGFDTGAKPFYTEISLKHNQWSGSSGFFAFWAMDTCHLYKTGCSQFYEPDFYEFISRMHVNAFHWWSSSMQKQDPSCINTQSAGITPDGKDTNFNIYGARFTNEGTSYYYNDKANIPEACATKAWSKNIPVGPEPGKTGKYPIIFGTGPNQPYEADFVRVWQAP